MCSSPEQFLQHLDTQLSHQQPHFGTRLTQQLLQQADSAVQEAGSAVKQHLPTEVQQLTGASVHLPAAPQLPTVSLPRLQDISLPNLPRVELPKPQIQELHLPAIQPPSVSLTDVQLPDAKAMLQAINDTAAGATHLPETIQQQLALVQQQLLQLARTTDAPLQPHFGTQAVLAWLQEAQQALASALHLPMMQLPAVQHIAWQSLTGNISSNMLSSPIGVAGATPESLKASLIAATALVAHTLPEAVGSWMAASGLQEPAAIAVAGWQQLQDSLLQLQQALLLLPEQGMGGYDLPTLCLITAGTVAATAASAMSQEAFTAADADDVSDQLSYDYDADAVAAYFKRRPVLVAQRSVQLAMELTKFGLALLTDMWTSRLQVMTGISTRLNSSAVHASAVKGHRARRC